MKPIQSVAVWLVVCIFCDHSHVIAEEVQIIRDRHFQHGFHVVQNGAPPSKLEGQIMTSNDKSSPAWRLCQWNSRGSVLDSPQENLSSGAIRYRTPLKALIANAKPGSSESDLMLEVNGSSEYQGVFRSHGSQWPHLLVEQSFENGGKTNRRGEAVGEMKALQFNIEAKLRFDHRNAQTDYDPKIHASQFVFFLVIGNLNRDSEGFGEAIWFGVTLYDDRSDVTSSYVNLDIGTQKLIYDIGIRPFSSEIVRQGQWVHVKGDLLPHIQRGLEEAWKRGFLPHSQDLQDYFVAGMNMGWEITGLNHAAMQIRNLSLVADFPR